MRRCLVFVLACGGCLSDLAVGMSNSRVVLEDAASSLDDAGTLDDAQVSELDAWVPDLDADGPVLLDADASLRSDASQYPKVCAETECIHYLVPADQCDDGGTRTCARQGASQGCVYLCL